MATYAIGDVQGCFDVLQRLISKLPMNPADDTLWLAGDLVNRGPDSLAALRWAVHYEGNIQMVLGNHDLHLLATYYGVERAKKGDTMDAILQAPDAPLLMDWLRRRPLLCIKPPFVMVHAGILPAWQISVAVRLARQIESLLAGPDPHGALRQLLAKPLPTRWTDDLPQEKALAFAAACFTRLRMCHTPADPDFKYKGTVEQAPHGLHPWFELGAFPRRTIVFGHWAALGLRVKARYIALDSGCVWGNALSAVRLEDRHVFQEPCRG